MVNVDINPPTYQQATKEVQQIIQIENIYPELNEKGKESPKNFSKLERKHLCFAGKRERIEAKLAWKKHKLEHKLNKIHEMKTIEPSKKSIQIVEDGKVIQEFGGVDSSEHLRRAISKAIHHLEKCQIKENRKNEKFEGKLKKKIEKIEKKSSEMSEKPPILLSA